jgi:DNA repair exonuclease SbcCD ATPase subunit
VSGAGGFQFSLQPRLDQLKDEKTACQAALLKAREAQSGEIAAMERLESRRAELTQLLHAPTDNTSEARDENRPGPAYELIDQGRTFDTFAAEIEAVDDQIKRQREKITLAGELVKEREQDLAKVVTDVQALERLLERQKDDWQREVDKARQSDVDDAAIAAWVRRNKPQS